MGYGHHVPTCAHNHPIAHICELPTKEERHRWSKAGLLPGPKGMLHMEAFGCRGGRVLHKGSKRRACLRLGQAVGKRSERGLEVSTSARSLFLRGQPGLACWFSQQMGDLCESQLRNTNSSGGKAWVSRHEDEQGTKVQAIQLSIGEQY